MAFTRVQFDQIETGSTPGSVQVTLNGVAAGNLLIACAINRGSIADTTISDDQSNTWAEAKRQTHTDTYSAEISYAQNVASGNTVITATGDGTALGLIVAEYSGAATSNVFDVANSNNAFDGSTNPVTSGDIVTAENDELLIGYIFHLNAATRTFTVDAPWGEITNGDIPVSDKHIAFERLDVAQGTYALTGGMNANVRYGALIASFLGDGGTPPPSGPPVGSLMMMGVGR